MAQLIDWNELQYFEFFANKISPVYFLDMTRQLFL